MRFTIFGLTLSSSWGNGHATVYRALLRALHRRGHEITFFEKDVEYYAFRRDFNVCDFCDLRLYRDWDEVRPDALALTAESDVVIIGSYCPEGARIADEVLSLARPKKIFYDLDTPVTLARFPVGQPDYIRADQIAEFDLVLSFTGGPALEQLRQQYGARQALPLYGCVDPALYQSVPARDEFRCALSYMGTHAADRQTKLDEFFLEAARRQPARNFVLAGTLYPWSWTWPPNVRRFDHVAPADHPALFSSSRLTLNITRAEMAANGWCPSGRFFEAAACSTPVITDCWPGLEDFFTLGDEVIVARNTEDVLAALQLSDAELQAIASRARERTLDQYTGDYRARELLSYLGSSRTAAKEEKLEMAL